MTSLLKAKEEIKKKPNGIAPQLPETIRRNATTKEPRHYLTKGSI
jgi:hypothetical protein